MHARRFVLAAAITVVAGAAGAQTPAKVRGTVESVEANTIHVMQATGGEAVLALPSDVRVTLVEPTTLAAVKPGSFIGTAAETQADGSLVAVEVHVFPESMRGAGEGHRPFDLGPKSTMTNGTVGQEVVGTSGQTLTVRYKGGEKAIVVPPTAPVVAFAPGDRGALVAGAHVVAFAKPGPDGALAAATLLVGRDGFTPPL